VVPVRSYALVGEAQKLGAAVRRFGLAIPRVLAKYREQVLEQQLVLNRLANCAMAIYTSTAVIGKLDADLQRVGGNAAALGNDVAVAKLYLQEAFATIDQNLGSLHHNNDQDILRVAEQLTGIS
jgi:hypothetical protein